MRSAIRPASLPKRSSGGQSFSAQLGVQPQGYYGQDGQWYAYAPQPGYAPPGYGYPPAQDPSAPQGYYGQDGQWYPYAQPQPGYAPQGYAPQGYAPQGYYAQDGQWYPYVQQPMPQGYAPTGYAPQGYPAPAYGYAPADAAAAYPPGAWNEQGQWVPAVAPEGTPEQAPSAEEAQPALVFTPEAEPISAEVDLPSEVSADEVMEIGDDEVQPIYSAPVAAPQPHAAAPVPSMPGADSVDELRQALSFDDEAPAQAAPVIPYVPPMIPFPAPRAAAAAPPRHPLPSAPDPVAALEATAPAPAPDDDLNFTFDGPKKRAPSAVEFDAALSMAPVAPHVAPVTVAPVAEPVSAAVPQVC